MYKKDKTVKKRVRCLSGKKKSARDRERGWTLKTFLEANAKWSVSDNDLRRINNETSSLNPELPKKFCHGKRVNVVSEITTTVKTAAGSIYRRSDIARATVPVQDWQLWDQKEVRRIR